MTNEQLKELEDCYKEEKSELLAYAMSLAKHKEDAKDLVNQVYLNCHEHIEAGGQIEEKPIIKYFKTAIHNAFVNYAKHKKVVRTHLEKGEKGNDEEVEEYKNEEGEEETKLEAKEEEAAREKKAIWNVIGAARQFSLDERHKILKTEMSLHSGEQLGQSALFAIKI